MKLIEEIERFTIYPENDRERNLLKAICKNLITYKRVFDFRTKRNKVIPDKDWRGGNRYRQEYIFPKFMAVELGAEMRRRSIPFDVIKSSKRKDYPTNKLNLVSKDTRTPRDYQKKYIQTLTKPKGFRRYVTVLQTGQGKTFIATEAIKKINETVFICILAKYIPKWKDDIEGAFELQDGDLYIIKGADSLNKLFEMKEKPKFIIASTRTMSNYYKDYETLHPSMFKYSVKPPDMGRNFKTGVLLIDEIHAEFYVMFKTILYMNTKKTIGLTATFSSADRGVQGLMNRLFTSELRPNFLEHQKYAYVHPVGYNVYLSPAQQRKVVTNQGYNQGAYEDIILKSPQLRSVYMKLMLDYVKRGFIDRRKEGDKLLIFNASVAMCEYMVKVLKEHYPELFITKYTQEDAYEDLLRADISVSTLMSSGTALDIPGLFTVMNFNNTMSDINNKQSLGRLREREGAELRYYYFYNTAVKKQVDYHNYRLKLFAPIVKTIKTEYYKIDM